MILEREFFVIWRSGNRWNPFSDLSSIARLHSGRFAGIVPLPWINIARSLDAADYSRFWFRINNAWFDLAKPGRELAALRCPAWKWRKTVDMYHRDVRREGATRSRYRKGTRGERFARVRNGTITNKWRFPRGRSIGRTRQRPAERYCCYYSRGLTLRTVLIPRQRNRNARLALRFINTNSIGSLYFFPARCVVTFMLLISRATIE